MAGTARTSTNRPPRTADALLASARRGVRRLEPIDALRACQDGALLIDTRPEAQRRRDGDLPGALVVDRNVLEWRLDPLGEHRLAEVTSHDQQIILVCNEGYSSSLAVATLRRMGLHRATDVVGGFQKWAAQRLPVSRA